jgi:hypothetical protein
MANTASATACVLLQIGTGAMKACGIYSQWRSELFFIVIVLLFIGRGAMNAHRLKKLRKEHLARVRIFFCQPLAIAFIIAR